MSYLEAPTEEVPFAHLKYEIFTENVTYWYYANMFVISTLENIII